MLWPKASPLDLDFGLCAWAKLFKNSLWIWISWIITNCSQLPTATLTHLHPTHLVLYSSEEAEYMMSIQVHDDIVTVSSTESCIK